MKSVLVKLAAKKGIFTKTMVVASLVLITLPSCKHKGGTCDAYQGSTRSVKKTWHHAE